MPVAIRRSRTRLQPEALERRMLLNGAGDPDPTFGDGHGYATLPLSFPPLITNYSEPEIPWKTVVTEPDGKVVVSGAIDGLLAGSFQLAVGRFNADGTPDDTFGVGGLTRLPLLPGEYEDLSTVVQADVAVYLPTLAAFAIQPPGGGPAVIVPFGTPGLGATIPVPGDYDGSGHVELAVYIPAFGKFIYRPYGGGVPDVVVPFGTPGVGELPAVGDYEGTGRTDVAVYDPSRGFLAYRPAIGGPDVFVYYGTPVDGSIPVTTPPGALPEFAGPLTGSKPSAIGSNTTPTAPAPAVAATQARASAVPAGPMLTSIRVARSLVNQGSDDSSKSPD